MTGFAQTSHRDRALEDRNDRVCPECKVLGDEEHFLYDCQQIRRDDLQLPGSFADLWQHANVFKLFSRLVDIDVV